MKPAHRRELQTNDLANWIGLKLQKIEQNSLPILLGLAGICIAALIGWYFLSSRSADNQARWAAYYTGSYNPNDSDLRDLANRYPATLPGQYARLQLAYRQLALASNQLVENRAEGLTSLDLAQSSFEELLAITRDTTLRQQAMVGLARALESQGKLDEATRQYEEIVATWPESVYAEEARERVASLKLPSTRSFYAWAADYKRVSPVGGEPGIPGLRPEMNFDNLPSTGPAGGISPGGAWTLDPFGTGSTPPASSNSSAAPTDEMPVNTDAPATDTPATETTMTEVEVVEPASPPPATDPPATPESPAASDPPAAPDAPAATDGDQQPSAP